MKNMFHKIGGLVARVGGKLFIRNSLQLNEDDARKIQKSEYETIIRQLEEVGECSPTYKKILEQLDLDGSQIVIAAIYNLTKIAVNHKKYSHDILDALENLEKKKSLDKEIKSYLSDKIAVIKKASV